ncbi:MAG: hypothetical protein HY718_15890 [Planctomycetes bacterium]|nr:hypothetical protein [Planctomycetota bacterium]
MSDVSAHKQMALDFLAGELGRDAPRDLTAAATFDEHPLEKEGCVTVFAFDASIGGNPVEPFYVVAGETSTNYYPQWGLDPEQIYDVHLGTRFMLVVEVQQLPLAELPPTLESDARDRLAGVVPGAPVAEFRPVAAFVAEGHKHAVCRARIADEEVHVLAGDLPLGIYRLINLPPHVVYRLHLGNIIRMERDDGTEE